MGFRKNSVKRFLKLLCCIAIVLAAMCAAASDVKKAGPENILIFGGIRGNVHFPHWIHQKSIGDCTVCHSVFPQTKGAIESLKGAGKLKNKQVMETLCVKCHRDKQMQGVKSGPTTCSKCHMGS